MHTPLPREALLDAMETLYDLLAHEPHAAVRGVLSHHLFVSIGISNHLFPHARLYGRIRQLNLAVGVSYATDMNVALSAIDEILRANPRVLRDPAP